ARPVARVAARFALGLAALGLSSTASAQTSPEPSVSRGADGKVRIENASREDALRLAGTWLNQGEPVRAEQLLAQITPVWPKDARIPFLRGLAARARGDERAAAAFFRAALALDPSADRARYELAKSDMALGKWDQAQFQLRFVLGSDASP